MPAFYDFDNIYVHLALCLSSYNVFYFGVQNVDKEKKYAEFEGERTFIYISTVDGDSPVLVAGNSSENYAPA